MITILGPTATGKTKLAAHIAHQLNGEIISADSRQVYREMNIGSGKDYSDYIVEGKKIPYHLIDIVEPGIEYNVFKYQKDFKKVYSEIIGNEKIPVLCGGSGMYLEAVIKGYRIPDVPQNEKMRKKLENKTQEELVNILSSLQKLHNTTDILDRDRLVKAIEIATWHKEHPETTNDNPKFKTQIFGIHHDREIIREKITKRLKERLSNGMLEEVETLLGKGISSEKLKSYGLEYKFITQYILGEINKDDMFRKLNTAIHQFAKRQMTWFRRMERNGIKINWIDGELTLEKKIGKILELKNIEANFFEQELKN